MPFEHHVRGLGVEVDAGSPRPEDRVDHVRHHAGGDPSDEHQAPLELATQFRRRGVDPAMRIAQFLVEAPPLAVEADRPALVIGGILQVGGAADLEVAAQELALVLDGGAGLGVHRNLLDGGRGKVLQRGDVRTQLAIALLLGCKHLALSAEVDERADGHHAGIPDFTPVAGRVRLEHRGRPVDPQVPLLKRQAASVGEDQGVPLHGHRRRVHPKLQHGGRDSELRQVAVGRRPERPDAPVLAVGVGRRIHEADAGRGRSQCGDRRRVHRRTLAEPGRHELHHGSEGLVAIERLVKQQALRKAVERGVALRQDQAVRLCRRRRLARGTHADELLPRRQLLELRRALHEAGAPFAVQPGTRGDVRRLGSDVLGDRLHQVLEGTMPFLPAPQLGVQAPLVHVDREHGRRLRDRPGQRTVRLRVLRIAEEDVHRHRLRARARDLVEGDRQHVTGPRPAADGVERAVIDRHQLDPVAHRLGRGARAQEALVLRPPFDAVQEPRHPGKHHGDRGEKSGNEDDAGGALHDRSVKVEKAPRVSERAFHGRSTHSPCFSWPMTVISASCRDSAG